MRRSDSRTSLAGDSLSNILYRNADLTPGAGRTVFGIAIPYGQVADVSDGDGRVIRERFEFGACRRTISERGSKIKLLAQHDHRRFPIGKATCSRNAPMDFTPSSPSPAHAKATTS